MLDSNFDSFADSGTRVHIGRPMLVLILALSSDGVPEGSITDVATEVTYTGDRRSTVHACSVARKPHFISAVPVPAGSDIFTEAKLP